MHVERREPRDQAKDWTYFVVYAGKICPVCEVESFCGDLQVSPLAYFVPPAQAHVEVDIVGTQTSVARRSDGTFVGGVIVAVYLSSREQVERMSAVVGENRGQL